MEKKNSNPYHQPPKKDVPDFSKNDFQTNDPGKYDLVN